MYKVHALSPTEHYEYMELLDAVPAAWLSYNITVLAK